MLRFPLIVLSTMLLAGRSVRAQQPLSFEPGGREACAKAIGKPLPRPGDDAHSFNIACYQRDKDSERVRFNALDTALEQAPADQRIAFNALMVAFTAFADAHTSSDHCASGNTACVESQEAQRVRMSSEFLLLAEGHPAGGFPAFTSDDLVTADADLNDSYQRIFAKLPDGCGNTSQTCVSQAIFRETQRAWIRFRDAWLTFANLRWPEVPSSAWLTLLTQQRAQQLKNTATKVP